tara:strand:- start:74572 stop:74778 length:207 start_codon:yes stop_codon:yes gene_type:complete
MEAGSERTKTAPMVIRCGGRPLVTVKSSTRQGVTIQLHSGTGASDEDIMDAVRSALDRLEDEGRGLQP